MADILDILSSLIQYRTTIQSDSSISKTDFRQEASTIRSLR